LALFVRLFPRITTLQGYLKSHPQLTKHFRKFRRDIAFQSGQILAHCFNASACPLLMLSALPQKADIG
jgi:hypothetical protein